MRHTRLLTAACVVALGATAIAPALAAGVAVASVTAAAATSGAPSGFDAVVEAVRQTVVAAQVPGAVVQLDVKVGDRVQAGQVLLRIDARAADQNAAASDAQVQAARAALEVAAKDYQRQQQLFKKNYISQAALERAESEFKATQASVDAQRAQAAAARTQTGFHVVRAPYAGVVAEVAVMLGDMAMPGRPLLTLYDPTALRVTASVPQAIAARLQPGASARVELPGLAPAGASVTPTHVQVLPTIDAATHTVPMRADLPPGLPGAVPGMFARLWLPLAAGGLGAVTVPLPAVVRRTEITGLYVLDPAGRPVLRQVRLGRIDGDRVEVLSGLSAGERVASDPQAAALAR